MYINSKINISNGIGFGETTNFKNKKKLKKDRNWNKKNVINLDELDGYF